MLTFIVMRSRQSKFPPYVTPKLKSWRRKINKYPTWWDFLIANLSFLLLTKFSVTSETSYDLQKTLLAAHLWNKLELWVVVLSLSRRGCGAQLLCHPLLCTSLVSPPSFLVLREK